MKFKLHILLIVCFCFTVNTLGQGITCGTSEPFCAGDATLTFPNTANGSNAEPGPDYGCLGIQPNPAWYFIQIDQGGDLLFEISQNTKEDFTGSGLDVDFIAYGPFSNTNVCDQLTFGNRVACSFSSAAVENFTILDAQDGDIYVLLITNFAGLPGYIQLEQTNAGRPTAGETDCSILNTVHYCDGDVVDLDATTNNAVSYEWAKDGVPLTVTGAILTGVSAPSALYTVNTFDAAGNDLATIEFDVVFSDIPTIAPISDQLVCDDDNDGFWDFDLDALVPTILGSQAEEDYTVSFHASQGAADTDGQPLTSPYTNLSAYGIEPVYIRVENNTNPDCFSTASFNINVFDTPTATPVDVVLCDSSTDPAADDTNGMEEFDLTVLDAQVLAGQDPMMYSVSYHMNPTDANANASALTSPFTNTIRDNQQIVARVEHSVNPNCYATANINLTINALPVVAPVVVLEQCDDDTDGISDFNLTEANASISGDYLNETFSYYTRLTDAETANMPIPTPTAYQNTDPSSAADVVFVRVENSNGCFRVAELHLNVSTSQIPVGTLYTVEACDDRAVDNDNNNGIATFDLSGVDAQIQTLFPPGQSITITYYENMTNALAESNAIADITNHRNDNSPYLQNIVVRVDNNTNNACLGLGEYVQLVTINPTPNRDPADLALCDETSSGDLMETFDLTQNEAYIINGDPNVVVSYHTSLVAAEGASGAIATPSAYQNINPLETIYVRVENTNSGCFTVVDFDVLVNPLPDTVVITNLDACENNTDGFFDFDLESKTSEILNGQDPSIFSVSYHASIGDAQSISNPLASPYQNTTRDSQLIYVAITNTVTGCVVSTQSFIIEVREGAQANSDGVDIVYVICDDTIETDGDPSNDSAQFDLTTVSADVLDGQDPNDYTLTYHATLQDAEDNTNPLPTLYENTSVGGNSANPQVIYARVGNNLSPNICYAITPLTLQVNPIPYFDLDERYVLCFNVNGTEAVGVPVIDTGLSASGYSFEWSLNGVVIPTETGPSLTPVEGGSYSVTATDVSTTAVSCTYTDATEVIESEPPAVVAAVSSLAFSDNHSIEASAAGMGTYEYSLDGGAWQTSNVFEDVTPGEHIVTARDIFGCGMSATTVTVMDYPEFFTPNNDGYNDTWNIYGIANQPQATIYIFDRYGKLIKQLSPTGEGWNGTFNGELLPTNDYWFTVEYNEPSTGEPKTYKSHFTLKR